MGWAKYRRIPALRCAPQRGAVSVAVTKRNLRVPRTAASMNGAGVPKGSRSTASNDRSERSAFASDFTTSMRRFSPARVVGDEIGCRGIPVVDRDRYPAFVCHPQPPDTGRPHGIEVVGGSEYGKEEDGGVAVERHPPVEEDGSGAGGELRVLVLRGHRKCGLSLGLFDQFHGVHNNPAPGDLYLPWNRPGQSDTGPSRSSSRIQKLIQFRFQLVWAGRVA